MNLTLIIQIATLISILIGIFAFFRGVHQYNKQMNVQVFLQYAKRYEEIMTSFPKNARVVRLQSQKALPKSSGELSLWALRYLNLCSEEFYLYKANYLSKRVWGIWAEELIRTLATPLFQREWSKLIHEFDAYPEFQSFVSSNQSKKANDDRNS